MRFDRTDRYYQHIMAAVLAVAVAMISPAGAQAALPDTPETFGAVLKSWDGEAARRAGQAPRRAGGRAATYHG